MTENYDYGSANIKLQNEIRRLQMQIHDLRAALIEVHNGGANWTGQTICRKALEKKYESLT